ncbi:MAG: hypothetical protein JWR88_778, partial [Pseudonocardia sp.]|nr:hypothetical protein [Pseudonocardia sp.]
MPVVLSWLRLDLRRRWRSLVVLGLLIALSAGVVLASMAGARRGATALERLLAPTLPATAVVLPNQPGFNWDAVRAMPGVAAVATFPVSGFDIDGIPREAAASTFPFDRNAMDTVERPVVLAGRLPDPNRVDEAVISPRFVDSYGKGVGDTVTLRLFRAEDDQAFASGNAAPPADGPSVPVTIVGVVRSFWFGDAPGYAGGLIPSAALFSQYRANLIGAHEILPINAMVRLDGGPAALPDFRTKLAALTGRSDIEMFDQGANATKIQKTINFESACLLAFGLAALLAAIVLVGQALARYVGAAIVDLQVLRALGMARGQAVVAACAGPALAAAVGMGVGTAGAILASRWLPFGNAQLLEPAPGVSIDLLVLVGGGLVLLLVLLAGSAAAGWLALGRQDKGVGRRSAVAAAAVRAG